ncbi:hypothetical protein [Sinomonas sp. ASV322]|uniref:hypothetical protein n=1 Tax=Sinomonas sp. ASV322 TaxID=3041920 RepID=UPI0027DC39B0|nr:hypothetical protein [Sinomonas sp. ASV322]MDQ4501464.1 hypothetical protein [Sinomonas sp. ASV322]
MEIVRDLPKGCSYRTDQIGSTTTVQISGTQITTHAAFEAAFAQLSPDISATGPCVWESPEHLAFTCIGTFNADTKAFKGASLSMVFLGDHAMQFMVGTDDPAFVGGAEAGAWKLAQEARRRNL